MAVEVFLPKMSDHMESGRILHWLVKEGEEVVRGQVLLEIETDKAIGELEAPETGILKGVRAQDGAEVPVGEALAFIARPDESIPTLPPLRLLSFESPVSPAAQAETQPIYRGEIKATPVARRVAKELGVDLSHVKGSGPNGIIRDEDVRSQAARVKPVISETVSLPESESRPTSQPETIYPDATTEIIPLTNIQLITGQRMVESFTSAPHFYLQAAVDMTLALEHLDQVRQQIEREIGERISLTVLLIKAASAAIKKNMRVNTIFEKDHLSASLQINIGVAIGTEEGLVVPVIKNAGDKSLTEITKDLKTYQAKAREMRFSAEDLSNGTFTISNLGMYGVDVFQAIINPPQSCILAVGRVIKTPVGLSDDQIGLRPMMNMTLSADHRVLDGIQAAKFLAEVKSYLETPSLML